MASSVLLELAGLKGGSAVADHTDWIELKSYEWDLQNAVNLHQADSAGAGTITVGDINCRKLVNMVTPELQARCCGGAPFDYAKIHVTRTAGGEGPSVFLKIKAMPAVISSYDGGAEDGESTTEETFKIHFKTVSVEYTHEDGSTTDFGWDVQNNASMSPDVA